MAPVLTKSERGDLRRETNLTHHGEYRCGKNRKHKMLKHTLLSAEGILILEPADALEVADFEAVVHDIDPYLAEHDSLAGVMIFAKAFPGWSNLEAAIGHLQLIQNYHTKIQRLAIVSDNGLLSALPSFAAHLVHPEVNHFSESEYEDALQWLREVAVTVGP